VLRIEGRTRDLARETSRVAYNPVHRWYYFSEMQTAEVLFIRVHDSANDGRARILERGERSRKLVRND
jgi:hypothetical protein